ncbi:MAG: tetratricopeptide repeat protein, partial [Deltaproteobacteria bacterium]|nr:tetratricopeptide repeat protein [Deltaproteobacteria bacterium]
ELAMAVTLEPTRGSLWNNLGFAHQSDGNLAEAEAEYRRAIELDPKLVSAHLNLATVMARRGDTAGARRAHEAARTIDAEDPRVLELGKELDTLLGATSATPKAP